MEQKLAQHVLAMQDDAYLMGHPEWAEIVKDAVKAAVTDELVEKCRQIIADARKDLGNDLRGYSVLDLLADNTDEQLNVLRAVMVKLEEPKYCYKCGEPYEWSLVQSGVEGWEMLSCLNCNIAPSAPWRRRKEADLPRREANG